MAPLKRAEEAQVTAEALKGAEGGMEWQRDRSKCKTEVDNDEVRKKGKEKTGEEEVQQMWEEPSLAVECTSLGPVVLSLQSPEHPVYVFETQAFWLEQFLKEADIERIHTCRHMYLQQLK